MTTEYLQKLQQLKLTGKVVEVKAKTPLPKVSEKRKAEKKEYVKIVAEMIKSDPFCEIREDGCQGKATGLHHMKKRSPATYLDKRFLKRACDNCNAWVELHPLEAMQKGHSISKHSALLASHDNEVGATVIEKVNI